MNRPTNPKTEEVALSLEDLRAGGDGRRPLGGWASGNYACVCQACGRQFVGDKRALSCAPCAYGAGGARTKADARAVSDEDVERFWSSCKRRDDDLGFTSVELWGKDEARAALEAYEKGRGA